MAVNLHNIEITSVPNICSNDVLVTNEQTDCQLLSFIKYLNLCDATHKFWNQLFKFLNVDTLSVDFNQLNDNSLKYNVINKALCKHFILCVTTHKLYYHQ